MGSRIRKMLLVGALSIATLASAADRKVTYSHTASAKNGYEVPNLGLLATRGGLEQQNVAALSVSNVFSRGDESRGLQGDSVNGFLWTTNSYFDKMFCDTSGKRRPFNFLEYDVGASYTTRQFSTMLGKAKADLGAQGFYYPGNQIGTQDTIFDGTISLNPRDDLTLSTNVRTLLNGQRRGGTAALVSATHSIPVAKGTTLNYGGEFAYSRDFFGFRGPMAARADVGVSHQHRSWTFSGGVRPTKALNAQGEGAFKPTSSINWYVSAKYTADVTKPISAVASTIAHAFR